MPKSPTWEQVARLLAARVSNYAYCDDHPISDPDSECPFCTDRAAYVVWAVKAGEPTTPAQYRLQPGEVMVPVTEIKRHWPVSDA